MLRTPSHRRLGGSSVIKVEIVSPVHNRKDLTLQCLRSISRLTADDIAIHTVIVDDGSTDGTSEAIAANFPETEVIHADGSLWFTEGTNVGVEAALRHVPDYVLLINDDQVFDGDALVHMVECANVTRDRSWGRFFCCGTGHICYFKRPRFGGRCSADGGIGSIKPSGVCRSVRSRSISSSETACLYQPRRSANVV